MHNYKKHFKEGGSFEIREYRTDGKVRVVGEDNSEYIKFINDDNVPEEVAYVAPPAPPTQEEQALARRYFSKPEIRKAFRYLGIAVKLNLMIKKEEEFEEDWNDNEHIDTEHPSLVQSLLDESLDIDTIKLQIGGLND